MQGAAVLKKQSPVSGLYADALFTGFGIVIRRRSQVEQADICTV
jgi:hypothetical protein